MILLHGPPGVGKTLTAETIALTTGRPLMTVSVAEIGVTAQEAEKSLTPVFADAARWEAVLLMDEADVFVEERTKGDLQRNGEPSRFAVCYSTNKATQASSSSPPTAPAQSTPPFNPASNSPSATKTSPRHKRPASTRTSSNTSPRMNSRTRQSCCRS